MAEPIAEVEFVCDEGSYWNEEHELTICDRGLRKLFGVPEETERIWLQLYSKPMTGSWPIVWSYGLFGVIDGDVFVECSLDIFAEDHLKLKEGTYYVKCLYEVIE